MKLKGQWVFLNVPFGSPHQYCENANYPGFNQPQAQLNHSLPSSACATGDVTASVCVSILILSCEKKWLVCRQLELFKLIPLPTPVFPSHPSVSLPRLLYMQAWNSVFITLCLAPMRVLLMRAPLWRPAQMCVRGLDNLCFPLLSTNWFFSTDPPPWVCSSSKGNRSW